MQLKKFVCIFILLIGTSILACSQRADSILNDVDSAQQQISNANLLHSDLNQSNAVFTTLGSYQVLDSLLKKSTFCSVRNAPVVVAVKLNKTKDPGFSFYFLLGTAIFLGLLKTLYYKYFTNLLRVFFNTSLRQSQLTDQLLQSKLPAFLYGILFYLVGGQYIYFLLQKTGHVKDNNFSLMIFLVVSLALIYLFKSTVTHIVGWVTGYRNDAVLYQFIVSLTNNILTIILLPLLFLIAFSEKWLSDLVVSFSYIMLGMVFLFRYIRAFGNLQRDLKIGSFHFVLYIISLEIMPLLLLYKIAWNILTNYL